LLTAVSGPIFTRIVVGAFPDEAVRVAQEVLKAPFALEVDHPPAKDDVFR